MATTQTIISDDGVTRVIETRDQGTNRLLCRDHINLTPEAANSATVEGDISVHLAQLTAAWAARTVKPGNAAAQTVGPDIKTQWQAILLTAKMARAYKRQFDAAE